MGSSVSAAAADVAGRSSLAVVDLMMFVGWFVVMVVDSASVFVVVGFVVAEVIVSAVVNVVG